MKVLIVAGGTGGHFYPGLAVAQTLSSCGDEVRFAVRIKDKVIPLLERENIPFLTLHASGLSRKNSFRLIWELLQNGRGFVDAMTHLSNERPDVVLAMGGYLSFPVGLAARLKKIPLLLHEQNVVPGLANRILNRLASLVAVSFPASQVKFSSSTVVTGNPVREEFRHLPDRQTVLKDWGLDPNKKTVLIFGGSLGAHRINELMLEAFKKALSLNSSWQVVHFTGEKDVDVVRRQYQQLPFQFYVQPYCHDMAKAYAVADIIFCRAGASTISELMAVKKPAFLIPYPFATENHQVANANVLVQLGVAMMSEEKELSKEKMGGFLEDLLEKDGWRELGKAYEKLVMDPFSSAQKIRDVLVNLKNNS